jgi:hypothetical protein
MVPDSRKVAGVRMVPDSRKVAGVRMVPDCRKVAGGTVGWFLIVESLQVVGWFQ